MARTIYIFFIILSLFSLLIFLISISRFVASDRSICFSLKTSVIGNLARTYFEPFPSLCVFRRLSRFRVIPV